MKFIPVIGEIWTAIESASLTVAAGVVAATGNTESANNLIRSAGNAWTEYSEVNLIANPINMAVQAGKGNHGEVDRLAKKLGDSAEGFADGLPVVGHVKGIVHHAMGDHDKGNRSLEASTRTIAVVGAGVATGGLGAGLAIGAAAGVGAGVAYDGTATLIDKAANKDKGTHHGTFALIDADKMNPNEITNSIMGVGADAFAGASVARGVKQVKTAKAKAAKSGQADLEAAYRASKDLKDTGVKPKAATKLTMDAVQESEKAAAALEKPPGCCNTLLKDKNAGNEVGGQSFKYQERVAIERRSEGQSITAAKKAADKERISEGSHLQYKHPEVEQALNQRVQASCSEHAAFNKMAERNPAYKPGNINVASVYRSAAKDAVHAYITKHRCANCKAYGKKMGNVVTDCIPEGLNVPVAPHVKVGHIMKVPVKVAVLIAGCTCKIPKELKLKAVKKTEGSEIGWEVV